MKRKRAIILILAAVCVLICAFSVPGAGAEVSTNLQVKTVYSKANRKLVESKTYTDADGNPVVALFLFIVSSQLSCKHKSPESSVLPVRPVCGSFSL